MAFDRLGYISDSVASSKGTSFSCNDPHDSDDEMQLTAPFFAWIEQPGSSM